MSTFRNGTMPGSTRARVTVTLETYVSSTWGSDTTLAQVFHQAKDSAEGELRNKLGTGWKVVGEVRVDAVTQGLGEVR